MKEGWINDSYVIAFDSKESERMTGAYGIGDYLPGHTIVALVGWDDFVVRAEADQHFRVPTVPLDQKYFDNLDETFDLDSLVPDKRFTGKIKWYIQPIIFGGDPSSEENMTWVDIETHQKLVRWWNQKYREVTQIGKPEA
jgi:hypothetical protein